MKHVPAGVILNPKEITETRDLLVLLARHLKSTMETAIAPGDVLPREKWARADFMEDRRALKTAERLIRQLAVTP